MGSQKEGDRKKKERRKDIKDFLNAIANLMIIIGMIIIVVSIIK